MIIVAAVGAVIVAGAYVARAESYLHQHVRVERNNGSKVVGEVLSEDEDLIKVKRGSTGWTTIPRDEIQQIVPLENFWKDIAKKEADAKTGEDWYQIALALEKEGFDKGTVDERINRVIKVDPNHEKARKRLGFVKRENERKEPVWLTKKQAEDYDRTHGAIVKDASAQEDRDWSKYKIIVRKPEKAPEYEIVTNLPKEYAEDYANFMVELKKQLTTLIEKEVYGKSGKKIGWIPFPCKICSGGTNKATCPRCGGRGEEPCTIFITNTHRMFMDLTPMQGVGGYYMGGPFPAGDRQENYGYVACERPIVCFHGQFGGTGNTFMVLAHEGTHQLEHRMWKGDMRALQMRPGWLTEGLSCYFGDGLVIGAPDKKTGVREMHVDVARDRLASLKRIMKQNPNADKFKVKQFTSVPSSMYDGLDYASAWSLIYFMLNSKDKFKFKGKEIDLKDAFAKFFSDNCEKGAIEEYMTQQLPAWIGLAKAMGIDNPKEGEEAIDELDKVWREYVFKLPIAPVGDFDAKDKKKWSSNELKFEISLPGGKKKSKFDWKLASTEDLVGGFYEQVAFTADNNARAIVCVFPNQENYDIEDSLDFARRNLVRTTYGRYSTTTPSLAPPVEGKPDEGPVAVEGTLAGSGVETRTITFKAKEAKVPGYVDSPKPNEQAVKIMVCRTAAKIFMLILTCDEADASKYEGELNEILASFAVTSG
jgi:hypothetical protein